LPDLHRATDAQPARSTGMTKRDNLLIVCAGDDSLHSEWFIHPRSFDIMTIYFGNDPERSDFYRINSDYYHRKKGLKIHLAREILLEQLFFTEHFRFQDYSFVWFPDDDVRFLNGPRQIESLFDVAHQVEADVFQPAIENEHFSKLWESTRLVPGAFAHRTNIVEIMAFGFSGNAFVSCLLAAIHVVDFSKSGWGIEPVWLRCGEVFFQRPLRTFVFDCVPITHTRPIGAGTSEVHLLGKYEACYLPQIETNRMTTIREYRNLAEVQADKEDGIHVDKDLIAENHRIRFEGFKRSRGFQ
jgi:hypothetical protein